MNSFYIFTTALIAFAVAIGAAAFWVFNIKEDKLPTLEKVPRSVFLGMLLVIPDLAWCIPNARPIMPDSLQGLLIPAAIVCAFLAFKFVDYLFSRALGGFFILLAYYFLHDSFAFRTPASPLFAAFCLVMGVIGLFFAGKPYLLRDFIRKSAQSKRLKWLSVSYLGLFSVLCLALGVAQLIRGKI